MTPRVRAVEEDVGNLLGMLAPDDRAALMALGRRRRYPRGAIVMRQGDRGDWVAVVLSGGLKITTLTIDGDERIRALAGPGWLLGHWEAVDEDPKPREGTVVAIEEVECLVLTGSEFRALLAERPNLSVAMFRDVLRILCRTQRRLIDTGLRDTPHRLAGALVELVDKHGARDADGIAIDLDLTQEELAALVAASRESVVRALASLRARGLVATGRRRITVVAMDELRRYAEDGDELCWT